MSRAYAKINLGLTVREKRPDGYHTIETVFHRVNVFDELELRRAAEITVRTDSSAIPSDQSNLCWRAADLLREHLGVRGGAQISLQKNIPVGAGLGGGSADAAWVLRNLPVFWEREVREDVVNSIALRLGSDVPYFLGRGSAVGRGRGEDLEYFELDLPYTILVCTPNIHISTAWAYQHVTPSSARPDLDIRATLLSGMHDPERLVRDLKNDFEPAVFREHPEIRDLKETLRKGGAVYASLSGSGSSVYGFFLRPVEAQALADQCAAMGYRAFLTPPHFQVPGQ